MADNKPKKGSVRRRVSLPVHRRKFENLSPKDKEIRRKALDVLADMRTKDGSLSQFARENKTTIRTMLRAVGSNVLVKTKGQRYAVSAIDTIDRPEMRIINKQGKTVWVKPKNSEQASLIGLYNAFTGQVLTSGKTNLRYNLKQDFVIDKRGKKHKLVFDTQKIIAVNEAIPDFETKTVYRSG